MTDGIEQHALLHNSSKKFQGNSILKHAEAIKRLIKDTESRTILDYGCGKGMQYLRHRIHDFWKVPLPACYDPGIPALSSLPFGRFDGVVCVDVMEHVEQELVLRTLGTIFAKAERFVYFSICTREANKSLPDGRNAHLTVKPEKWWRKQFAEFDNDDGLTIMVNFT